MSMITKATMLLDMMRDAGVEIKSRTQAKEVVGKDITQNNVFNGTGH